MPNNLEIEVAHITEKTKIYNETNNHEIGQTPAATRKIKLSF